MITLRAQRGMYLSHMGFADEPMVVVHRRLDDLEKSIAALNRIVAERLPPELTPEDQGDAVLRAINPAVEMRRVPKTIDD